MGYVGGSHIPDFKKDTHAEMLMSGDRAKNGKGAEIVISDMSDLPKVIDFFGGQKTDGKSTPFDFPEVSRRRRSRRCVWGRSAWAPRRCARLSRDRLCGECVDAQCCFPVQRVAACLSCGEHVVTTTKGSGQLDFELTWPGVDEYVPFPVSAHLTPLESGFVH